MITNITRITHAAAAKAAEEWNAAHSVLLPLPPEILVGCFSWLELRDLVKDTSPLITLLSPLADALRLLGSAGKALVYFNILAVITVVSNVLSFAFVGKRLARQATFSLIGMLKWIVVLSKYGRFHSEMHS